jgi:hypothetical protein
MPHSGILVTTPDAAILLAIRPMSNSQRTP